MSSAADRKSKLVYGILEFLDQSMSDGTLRSDDKESMEVAMQCISESFNVKYPGDKKMSMKPASLLSVFEVYAKTAEKKQPSQPQQSTSTSTSPKVASASEKAEAEALKTKGNQLMTSKHYNDAIEKYTEAIKLDGLNPVYYSNRAAAYSQSGQHTKAIEDSNQSIRVDENFAKGYSRLGHAYYSSGKYQEAVDAYEKGLALEPNNSVMKTSLGMAKAKLPSDVGTNDDEDNDDVDEDEEDILRPSRGAGGGVPDMGGLGGLASLMNNPALQNMMQSMGQNGGLDSLMQDPSIRDMAANMQRGGGMPDMASLMSNPALRNIAASMFGGAPGAGGAGGASGGSNRRGTGPDMYS